MRQPFDSGPAGLFLIIFCTVNVAYTSSRIPIIWELLEVDHPELRVFVRDPYPVLAEKAGLEMGAITSKCLRIIARGELRPKRYG